MTTTEIENRIRLQNILWEMQCIVTDTSATTYIYPCPIETEFIYQQIKYETINEYCWSLYTN